MAGDWFFDDLNNCLDANNQITVNYDIENLRLDSIVGLNLGLFLTFMVPLSPFIIVIVVKWFSECMKRLKSNYQTVSTSVDS